MTPTTDDETRSPFEIELGRLAARMDAALEKQAEIEATEPFDRAAAEAMSAEYFAAMNDFEEFVFGERPVPEDWWRRPALGAS